MAEFEDFLVEIGTEELPPMALERLSQAFGSGIVAGLEAAGLTHGKHREFNSPRRLAMYIPDLQTRQAESEVEKRGPAVQAAFDKDGKPTRAASGFAKSCGVEVSELETLETNKGSWLVHRYTEAGRETAELLPDIVQRALDSLPIPKRMRWGAHEVEFVRPVHWVVMLLGKTIVPATILGHSAGRETRGHRFMGEGRLPISQPDEYETLLENRGCVIADPAKRRARINDAIASAAKTAKGRAVIHEHVLQEVCALVEWPVAVTGAFDHRFLELPREALVATLEGHQRYFPLEDASGKLMPAFITISNIESRDPERVREGNERVVRPRLTDAEFFCQQDLQQPLEQLAGRLANVVFEKQLGSIAEKSARVAALAQIMAGELKTGADTVERAAILAKADLMSEMVGEFPELQGIMGSYYARAQGESDAVADALREQYLPRFAGDVLPATAAGQILALADRLDTLAGIFAIGKRPSGDKDPYALRRAAIGVLRILVEGKLALNLHKLLEQALAAQPVNASADTLAAMKDFMLERQRAWYLDAGIRHDVFDAVAALRPVSPLDFDQRLQAVQGFLERPECDALTAANKRLRNILRKSDDGHAGEQVNTGALIDPAEKHLHQALEEIRGEVSTQVADGNYQQALATLSGLRDSIDRFFDEVMVMADDDTTRNNRLTLLGHLEAQFLSVADLSRLQG